MLSASEGQILAGFGKMQNTGYFEKSNFKEVVEGRSQIIVIKE